MMELTSLPNEILFKITRHLRSKDLLNLRQSCRKLNEVVLENALSISVKEAYQPILDLRVEQSEFISGELVEWIQETVTGVIIRDDVDIQKLRCSHISFFNQTLVVYLLSSKSNYCGLVKLVAEYKKEIKALHVIFPAAYKQKPGAVDLQSVFVSIFMCTQVESLSLYCTSFWNYFVEKTSMQQERMDHLPNLKHLYIYGLNGIGVARSWFINSDYRKQLITLRIGPTTCDRSLLTNKLKQILDPPSLATELPSLRRALIHCTDFEETRLHLLPSIPAKNLCLKEISLVFRCRQVREQVRIAKIIKLVAIQYSNTLEELSISVSQIWDYGNEEINNWLAAILRRDTNGTPNLVKVKEVCISHSIVAQLCPFYTWLLQICPNAQTLSFQESLKYFMTHQDPEQRQNHFKRFARRLFADLKCVNKNIHFVSVPTLNLYENKCDAFSL